MKPRARPSSASRCGEKIFEGRTKCRVCRVDESLSLLRILFFFYFLVPRYVVIYIHVCMSRGRFSPPKLQGRKIPYSSSTIFNILPNRIHDDRIDVCTKVQVMCLPNQHTSLVILYVREDRLMKNKQKFISPERNVSPVCFGISEFSDIYQHGRERNFSQKSFLLRKTNCRFD